MRNQKLGNFDKDVNGGQVLDINNLIELFVELNFNDIHNEVLLFQFRILANKIGFSKDEIEKVIQLGHSEYLNLMQEINEGILKQNQMRVKLYPELD